MQNWWKSNYVYGKSTKKVEKWGNMNSVEKHGNYSYYKIMQNY